MLLWTKAILLDSVDNWSFDRKTLFDDEAKGQKLISVKSAHFNLKSMKCTKQLISTQICLELVAEGCQIRPVKCAHFERPLPGIVILVFWTWHWHWLWVGLNNLHIVPHHSGTNVLETLVRCYPNSYLTIRQYHFSSWIMSPPGIFLGKSYWMNLEVIYWRECIGLIVILDIIQQMGDVIEYSGTCLKCLPVNDTNLKYQIRDLEKWLRMEAPLFCGVRSHVKVSKVSFWTRNMILLANCNYKVLDNWLFYYIFVTAWLSFNFVLCSQNHLQHTAHVWNLPN